MLLRPLTLCLSSACYPIRDKPARHIREARSIPLINQLLNEGANVTAYDPVAVSNAKSILGDRIKSASSAIDPSKTLIVV